jgi:hypothetical protein
MSLYLPYLYIIIITKVKVKFAIKQAMKAQRGLDGCKKILPPLGFDPRTVQPVASHYTDTTPHSEAL